MILFGGSFDPIHYGHLTLLETLQSTYPHAELRLVPTPEPDYKSPILANRHHRLAMIRLALKDHPNMGVDTIEMDQTGPCWTYKTVRLLFEQNPGRPLFFAMGSDSYFAFHTWKNFQEIYPYTQILVLNRDAITPETYDRYYHKHLAFIPKSRFHFVTMPVTPVSSKDIRHHLTLKNSLAGLVPPAVEAYIKENRVYP